MASKLTSPGFVFTETDISQVPAATLGRAQAIVGTSRRGRAFIPQLFTDWDSFVASNGERDVYKHGPYCAFYTLKKSSPIVYTRVLGINADNSTSGNARNAGFSVGNAYAIIVSGSNGSGKVAAIIHTTSPLADCSGTSARNFFIKFNTADDSSGVTYTCSLNRSDKNHISKVLNTDPTAYPTSVNMIEEQTVTSKKYYLFRDFTFDPAILGGGSVSSSLLTSGNSYAYTYAHAQSPWVQSQNFGTVASPVKYSLFKFHALSDGEYENTNIKVTIFNIRNSVNTASTNFGTFDVYVRQYGDTDKDIKILEKFTGLSLDPDSVNYVASRVGDMSMTWNASTNKIDTAGNFPSKSSYIRVELNGDLKAGMVPEDAVPWGYNSSIPQLSSSVLLTSSINTVSALPLVLNQTWKGEYSSKICWGFTNANTSSGISWCLDDRLQFIPSGLSVTCDAAFSLDNLSSSNATVTSTGVITSSQFNTVYCLTGSNVTGNLSQSSVQATTLAQFTIPIYGGFDGLNIHYKDPLHNRKMVNFSDGGYTSATDWALSYEVNSLREGIDTLKNTDNIDIKDLCIPGIYHPGVLSYAIDMVSDRTDCFLICDISGSTVDNAKTWRENSFTYDSNYAGCYFPRLKVKDSYNNKYVWLYPTALVMGVLGANDIISYPWYAPAGFNRGDISSDVVQLEVETNTEDRNDLYDRQINPIAKLEGSVVVWGQKTLQQKASALDRINVRRMLLHIKKAFANFSKYLVFEPVNQNLYDRFKNLANPFLARIIQNNGLNGFSLIVDDSNNTPETRANNEVHIKLVLEPTTTGEKFFFDFVVTKQGTFSAQ